MANCALTLLCRAPETASRFLDVVLPTGKFSSFLGTYDPSTPPVCNDFPSCPSGRWYSLPGFFYFFFNPCARWEGGARFLRPSHFPNLFWEQAKISSPCSGYRDMNASDFCFPSPCVVFYVGDVAFPSRFCPSYWVRLDGPPPVYSANWFNEESLPPQTCIRGGGIPELFFCDIDALKRSLRNKPAFFLCSL